MRYDFAPMEGITDYVFRTIHHRFFPGVDRYFAPFLSPTLDGRFTGKKRKDVLPENNPDLVLVPQLLTKRPEDYHWAARALAELGYKEVNLNLGCPSGTVVAKGKGSGLLAELDGLERFLDGVFEGTPIEISIKTRLGMQDPEEFPALLELFGHYPLRELIVHTRVREDYYKRPARLEAFALPLEKSRCPVIYNGDLTTVEAIHRFSERYPQAEAVMLGRGLIADPSLLRRLNGGPGVARGELKEYHDTLFSAYCDAFQSERNALCRMKEIWFYMICLFEETEKLEKKLRKTTNPTEYRALAESILSGLPLRAEGAVPRW